MPGQSEMRFRFITVPGVLLIATLAAQAQEFPRWEAFGGFSYANIDLGSQAGAFGPTSRNYYWIRSGVQLQSTSKHPAAP
jgi:hypothetical protein